MGQTVTKIRDEAEYANEIERRKMEERLRIIEKMVQSHLDSEELQIMQGLRGDQQIHSGTVVQLFKEVNLKMENKDSDNLEEAVDDFLGGSFLKGFGKLIIGGVRAVLGNTTMGEYATNSMFIVWTSNALLRCDTYCYRWNFHSKGVIEKVEGAVGILMIQRVIDITKTDPQVLTWAITRQARLLGPGEDANRMIDEALEVIKKVAIFQKEVSKIEHDGRMIDYRSRYGSTDRLDRD